ncbi:MAG: hypothetical protein ACW99G_06920 [Candidatus Thorarchaeota archaeon]|jgi:hypothetical protein
MSDNILKIFGLPRTCTNVTEVLIVSNFICRLYNNFPCWKHGDNTIKGRVLHTVDGKGKEVKTDNLKYIVSTKNPYDWLWSLYSFENRTKLKNKKTIDDFLELPSWHYSSKLAHNGKWKKDISNPIDVFNYLTKQWLTMCPEGTIQVKHEDIISEEGQLLVLNNIENKFNLEKKQEDFITRPKRIDPARKITKNEFKKLESQFTKKHISIINKRLDDEVMKLSGYEKQEV